MEREKMLGVMRLGLEEYRKGTFGILKCPWCHNLIGLDEEIDGKFMYGGIEIWHMSCMDDEMSEGHLDKIEEISEDARED